MGKGEVARKVSEHARVETIERARSEETAKRAHEAAAVHGVHVDFTESAFDRTTRAAPPVVPQVSIPASLARPTTSAAVTYGVALGRPVAPSKLPASRTLLPGDGKLIDRVLGRITVEATKDEKEKHEVEGVIHQVLQHHRQFGLTPIERELFGHFASAPDIPIAWRVHDSRVGSSGIPGPGNVFFGQPESIQHAEPTHIKYRHDQDFGIYDVLLHEMSHVMDYQRQVPGYGTSGDRALYSEFRANLWATASDYDRAFRVTLGTYPTLSSFIRRHALNGLPPEQIYRALAVYCERVASGGADAESEAVRLVKDIAQSASDQRLPANHPDYAFPEYRLATAPGMLARETPLSIRQWRSARLYQLETVYDGRAGCFEWVVNDAGQVEGRAFVPAGRYTLGRISQGYYGRELEKILTTWLPVDAGQKKQPSPKIWMP